MKCYSCGEELTNSDICANCGSDVTAYKIVVKSSNSYYNQGLMKAQIRDLSGAVYCLRTSLSINKYNTKARNLLGLVYYEMGEVVEALSEWVISKNYKPDKNAADVFIKKVQSSQNKLEAMNQTIKKFNRCLEYAKDGSYDVAKIQLKKVIITNPKLIKAHLLLSLLLMRDGEYEKAKKYLVKALTIDKGNTLAQHYLMEANAGILERKKKSADINFVEPKPEAKNKDSERKALSGHDVIVPKGSYKEPSNGGLAVVNLLLGVAIGAALIWFLILPTKLNGVTNDSKKLIEQYVEQLSESSTKIAKLEADLQLANSDKEALNNNVGSYTAELDKYKKIVDAAAYNSLGNYVAAAESILAVNYEALPNEEQKNLYNQIWSNSFIKAYDALMNEGNTARNSGDNAGAASFYARAYKINPTDVAAYMAGVSYFDAKDNANAKAHFESVINKHPNSEYLGSSNNYLGQIQ